MTTKKTIVWYDIATGSWILEPILEDRVNLQILPNNAQEAQRILQDLTPDLYLTGLLASGQFERLPHFGEFIKRNEEAAARLRFHQRGQDYYHLEAGAAALVYEVRQQFPQLPIITISGGVLPELEEMYLTAGATEFHLGDAGADLGKRIDHYLGTKMFNRLHPINNSGRFSSAFDTFCQ